jgi:hypothetical protein
VCAKKKIIGKLKLGYNRKIRCYSKQTLEKNGGSISKCPQIYLNVQKI